MILTGLPSAIWVFKHQVRVCALGLLVVGCSSLVHQCIWNVLRHASSCSRCLFCVSHIASPASMMIQDHSLPKMSLVWLLPIIPLIVASSTGALLAQALKGHSAGDALLSVAVSLVMVLIGLTFGFMILTIYLTRLIIHGPPDVMVILSGFISLGPLGQGGFSLLVNGELLSELLPLHMGGDFPLDPLSGQMIYSFCFSGAFVLWSLGIAWLAVSLSATFGLLRTQKIPFSVAYWGLVFPNGVFALLSLQLGKVLDSPFFHYFGAIYSSKIFPSSLQ
jgi:tellurite resistance protein TehA-like permease